MYAGMYMGFESTGLFKIYPYQSLSSFTTFAYSCVGTGIATVGYDPRCRGWYSAAKDKATDKDVTVFGSPYLDATTGKSIVTASTAIYINNILLGVIGIDFNMIALDNIISQTNVFSNGYIFVMDVSGNLISYPKLNRNIAVTTVFTIESSIPVSIWNNILTSYSLTSTSVTTNKQDKLWHINYVYLPISRQYLVMMIPHSDLLVASDSMNSDLKNILKTMTIVLIVITCILFLVSLYINIKVARYYTIPYKNLTTAVTNITQGKLDDDMASDGPKSNELVNVRYNVRNLQIAVRVGVDTFYAGKPKKALTDFLSAKEFMEKVNNECGLGVCLNNIANVYKQLAMEQPKDSDKNREYFNAAVQNYTAAINIAKKLVVENSGNILAKKAYNITLGKRLMNMGVLYKDMERFDIALKHFNDAIECHRKEDDSTGIARVSGNMAQLYIQQNKLDIAEQLLTDTYGILIEKDDNMSMQYTTMNLGILYDARGNGEEANKWYKQTVEGFERIDIYVQTYCLERLAHYYEIGGNYELSGKMNADVKNKFVKNLMFALDCSGSMAGSRINQCRKSMIDIVNNFMNGADIISLITFNNVIREVFMNKQNSSDKVEIIDGINNKTKPDGGTAFYKALFDGINKFVGSKQNNWLVALTDGEDNASNVLGIGQRQYNDVGPVVKNIIELAKNNNINLKLVIITVGTDMGMSDITRICTAYKGNHIRIGINDISEAFKKVAKMLSGQMNFETL
jgi:tetratricopeptide (TPR) repeat protein/Mg-chelatase subunit ChlD